MNKNYTPEIIKISEVNPETYECVRVILIKNGPSLYTLMMEGYPEAESTEMKQLGTAKTFTNQDIAFIQFDTLVNSLSTAWES